MNAAIQKFVFNTLIVLLSTGIHTITAQCPNHISPTTQEQLEMLMGQYPDCEHLTGSLTISGSVTDLSSLANIKSIGGWLTIRDCPGLTSLQGLNNLVSVNGRVYVTNLDALTTLSGLEALTRIGESLHLLDLNALQSLDGLQNLSVVGMDILLGGSYIGGQTFLEAPQLTSVAALAELDTVYGGFEIHNCDKLVVIDGINDLKSAGGILIAENATLTEINGFESLETTTSATNFHGFSVDDNPKLKTINGTRALKTSANIRIFGDSLTQVAFDNLEAVQGFLRLEAFEMASMPDLPKLKTIDESLILSIGVPNLSGFPVLDSIGGMLLIDAREYTESISGFNNLKDIGIGQLGWGFDIYQHDKLTSISGFQALEDVVGDFVIANNDMLISVEGLRQLKSVGGIFSISTNSILNDCSPFCAFLKDGSVGESINISFNGEVAGGCRTEQVVRDRCEVKLSVLDANPEFFPPDLSAFNLVTELSMEQITQLNTIRDAISADGVSEVVLKLSLPDPGHIEFVLPVDAVTFPWGNMTVPDGDIHYCYALYSPPATFNPSQAATFRYQDDVLATRQSLSFEFVDNKNEHKTLDFDIVVVRPPVILIHGTYSSPDKWKEAAAGGQSMYDALMEADYKIFLLNYASQNGSDNSTESDFTDIVNVLRENPGGIDEALEYYRGTLNTAATQVDVIGHSLGGVIPRIYASEYYNPDGYKRHENFMEGDLNRIISIGGTHFGSHLAEFQYFLENGISILDVGPLEWVQAATLTYLTASWLGAPLSEAVVDQLPMPMGEALQNLGATAVPSHAIAMSVPRGNLKNDVYDPDDEYYDMFWYSTLLMQMNDDIREQYLNYKLSLKEMGLQAATTLEGGDPKELFPRYNDLMLFKSMVEDGIKRSGQVLSVMDGTFEIPSEATILKYVMAETGMSDIVNVDPFIDIFIGGANPAGVVLSYITSHTTPNGESILNKYLTVHDESMEAVRFLIFNNDENDGVVRVQSQTGELEKFSEEYVSRFNNHLHGFALTYPDIQARVLGLLDGGLAHFRMEGFPGADHGQMLYYPSDELDLYRVPRMGGEAICQSGMVPEHAKAFARVADEQNVIILVRPVNPDATPLISSGAATKVMDVKPKSSNWGPQRGYLPVEQRYSKLWKAFEGGKRDTMIMKYNAKAQENLTSGITVARPLQVKTCDGFYWVRIDSTQLLDEGDLSAENEVVLIPVNDPLMVCYYGDNFTTDMIITDCEPRLHDRYGTLEVMATPDVLEDDGVTLRYLTADYDILMFGFHKGENNPHDPPQSIEFKDGVGQITPEQETLLDKLNNEVRATGYEGGNVSHHGPENQFALSPYIDYPLTVFMPDDIPNGFLFGGTDGQVLSIDMGEPGFRDIYLKQFVNKMRKEGYDLYTNVHGPGWQWTWDEGREGYLLEDAQGLPSYVEALPLRKCDKLGYETGTLCGPDYHPGVASEKPEHTSWLGLGGSASNNWTISPNPVIYDALNIHLSCTEPGDFTFRIIDALGGIRLSQRFKLEPGEHMLYLPVDHLEKGVYSVQSKSLGSIRFLRL